MGKDEKTKDREKPSESVSSNRTPLERPAANATVAWLDSKSSQSEPSAKEPNNLVPEELLLAPEQRVDGYEVIRELGKGGMGVVYLARDVTLGRKAALKIIRSEWTESDDARERLLFEARVTAKLNHPHIVTIYGSGEVSGCLYIALEYLKGENLRERIKKGPSSLGEVLSIALNIAQALHTAHEHGILHRDLKPENVFLPRDGRLRVLDFGLAKFLQPIETAETRLQEQSSETSTSSALRSIVDAFETGQTGIVGTVPYLSPEQWQGKSLTSAVDMWALGVILFEMLTGKRPYEGATWHLATQVCSDQNVPRIDEIVPDIPTPVTDLVARCLIKDPTARVTATEASEELSRLVHGRTRQTSSRLSEPSPFRGLLPFRSKDADRFFGRQAEIDAFVEKLRIQPLVPVVGASGAGKSSFAMAGVIPALESRGDWLTFQMRPGQNPYKSLASCLLSPTLDSPQPTGKGISTMSSEILKMFGGAGTDELAEDLQASTPLMGRLLRAEAKFRNRRILLLVDQFEELFTLVSDFGLRTSFAETLCLATDDVESPIRVIITIRDDFLSHLAEHPGMAGVIDSGVTVLRMPGREALSDILQFPLEACGYVFEDESLASDMIGEVINEPTGLPLLQFAAQRLWESRDEKRRVLRRSVFAEFGGVAGALADHADKVLLELGPEKALVARTLLLRLITSEGTRKQVSRIELLADLDTAAGTVLDRLVSTRLIVSRRSRVEKSETFFELAHESMLVRWEQFRRWVEESHDDIAFKEQLESATRIWSSRGKRKEDLWRGESLTEARKWKKRAADPLPASILEFLETASLEERRATIRKKWFRVGAVSLVTLIALGSTMAAFVISDKERKARKAEAEAQLAADHARSAQNAAQTNMALSLLSDARAAFQRQNLPEARAKLRSSIEIADSSGARALWSVISRDARYFVSQNNWLNFQTVFSPDGRTLATSGTETAIRLWDIETGETRFLRDSGRENWSLTFSPDGKKVLSADMQGSIHIWDVETGSTKKYPGHKGYVKSIIVDPTSRFVYTSGADRTVRAWKYGSFEPLWTTSTTELFEPLSTNPDGSRLASASWDGTIIIIDTKNGQIINRWVGHQGRIMTVAFLDSAKELLTSGGDGALRIWDIEQGRILRDIPRVGGDHLALGPEKRFVVATGKQATLWDLELGETIGRFPEPPLNAKVAFSPDGKLVSAAGFDGMVTVWRRGSAKSRTSASHSQTMTGVEFSPDGRWIATGSWDGQIILWSIHDGRGFVLGRQDDGVRDVRFSDDGRVVAAAGNNQTIRLWDVASRKFFRVLGGHSHMVWGLRFSPDHETLMSGSYDSTIRTWNVTNGRMISVFEGTPGAHFRGLAIHPSGSMYAVGVNNGIHLFSTSDGRALRFLEVPRTNRCSFLQFSPDGNLLATGSLDGGGILFDISTGAVALRIGKDTPPFDGVAFSPDGQLLATASADRYLRVWSTTDGNLTTKLLSPMPTLLNVDFSPDGQLIAATSEEATLVVFELEEKRWKWRAPLLLGKPQPLLIDMEGVKRLADRHNNTTTILDLSALEPTFVAPMKAVAERAAKAWVDDELHSLAFITADGYVEWWDLSVGKQKATIDIEDIEKVLPFKNGLVAFNKGNVDLWNCEAGQLNKCAFKRLVGGGATAVHVNDDQILVAVSGEIRRIGPTGIVDVLTRIDTGATAFIEMKEAVVVGYQDGSIEYCGLDPVEVARIKVFEDTPKESVELITRVTNDVVAAGFGDGSVGLWNVKSGRHLDSFKMHGPLVHLKVYEGFLYAATAVGEHMAHDLGVYYREYCDILREIWDAVPVVWMDEHPVRLRPDSDHHCWK